MKTGDQRVATILAVVAVGAIAFLVVSLTKGRRGDQGREGTGAMVTDHSEARASMLPVALTRNPFRLSVAPAAKKQVPAVAPPAPDDHLGKLDRSDGSAPFEPRITGTLPRDAAEVVAPGGKDKEPAQHVLTLTATMLVKNPTALISLDGQEEAACHEGDTVAPGVRLIEVTASQIVLSVNGKRRSLGIGEQVSL